MLENQRLQERIDSMEFIRRNYASSSRQYVKASSTGISNLHSLPPPPSSSNRSGRAPSISRFASVERETDSFFSPPFKSREPSVARRCSRDYSNDRWSTKRDSFTIGQYAENNSMKSNKHRLDCWSTMHWSSSRSNPPFQYTCMATKCCMQLLPVVLLCS